MILSKGNFEQAQQSPEILSPGSQTLELPEKVLQFGTGVLLRGLPDFIINKANQKGKFNGRIVVVKSTSSGGVDSFDEQNSLYTVCIRGVEGENHVEENHLVTAVSRVLSASSEWDQILECAANPDMEVILSNTTELGIKLTDDDVNANPPESFPGKLLAFLRRRYEAFDKNADKGVVIIPTELIPDNGTKLKEIVIALAKQNNLDEAFLQWISDANHFCNSLVDRIVPGRFGSEEHAAMEDKLGYKDDLMIMSEPYALWAIESSDKKVNQLLSFALPGEGAIIAPDINKFRELKLRLLNGSHTFTCGLAYLAGFTTVKEAMQDEAFAAFIKKLMKQEIIPALVGDMISEEDAEEFAGKVLDRYRNPFIEHQWLSICVQYSSKMHMRNVYLIQAFAERFGESSPLMAMGMAAHILFLKGTKGEDGKYFGERNGEQYPITDQHAEIYSKAWEQSSPNEVVTTILSNQDLWKTDLTTVPGFADMVTSYLNEMQGHGVKAVLQNSKTVKQSMEK